MKPLRTWRAATVTEGPAPTVAYADRSDASEAHLIVVDRLPAMVAGSPPSFGGSTARPGSKKISRPSKKHDGRVITVWGM